MAKAVHDDVLDGAWNIIKNNCTKIVICSTQPTNYTEANSTYDLANVTVDSSDFTAANGDVSGRKLTTGAQSGVSITDSGDATHVAWLDVANSKLLYVTTCTTQTLTAGGTVNIPACDFEIADPT